MESRDNRISQLTPTPPKIYRLILSLRDSITLSQGVTWQNSDFVKTRNRAVRLINPVLEALAEQGSFHLSPADPAYPIWETKIRTVLKDSHSGLSRLCQAEFTKQIGRLYFHLSDFPVPDSGDFIGIEKTYPRVAEISQQILQLIDRYLERSGEGSKQAVRALKLIIPEQKIAPLQFAISEGRLKVLEQRAAAAAEDASNIALARDAILSRGKKVIEELRRSNCDRRLLESVEELQNDLAVNSNVIQLGLVNIGCEAVCQAFEKELPDALRGMLLGHTRNVLMYVAQFPDWQRFSEKATFVEFSPMDISRVSETAKRLISDLEANPEIADLEVPKTIRVLQHLVESPMTTSKRAVYALLRTIENLIAKVFQYSIDFIEKTATKTSDRLSSAASRLVVVTLMTFAVASALEMSPLAAKVADTAWLKTAAEIVQKQIEELAP